MEATLLNHPTPQGFSAVRPYLMVEDINREIDFLKTVFNAKVFQQLKGVDEKTIHGELQIGNTIVMIGQQTENIPSSPGMNYVYVDDVDEVYETAVKEGAVSIVPPTDQVYGNRECGFNDPYNNTWWVAETITNDEPVSLSVRPYLMADNIEKQADFIQNVFEGTVFLQANDEHATVYAEVQIGDAIIMIGKTAKPLATSAGMNYVYVADVDKTYLAALRAGAASIAAPIFQFYGNKEGGFKDMQGNTWWVSQFIKDVSDEEIERVAISMKK